MVMTIWNRALVTGASSGIGEEIARQLAARGTDLIVVARSVDRLEELGAELSEAHGIDVEVLGADLADPKDLTRVEERLRDPDETVDLLVNNAGFGSTGTFWELPLETEDSEIAVNVTALVRLTHAAVGPMVERRRGWVLNVSSIAGLGPLPKNAVYGATKAFVNSFSDALHEELRGTGVSVTTVLPGFTRTNFQQRSGYESSALPGWAWLDAERVAKDALSATADGKARVIPSVGYRVFSAMAEPVPPGLARRVVGFGNRRLQR